MKILPKKTLYIFMGLIFLYIIISILLYFSLIITQADISYYENGILHEAYSLKSFNEASKYFVLLILLGSSTLILFLTIFIKSLKSSTKLK